MTSGPLQQRVPFLFFICSCFLFFSANGQTAASVWADYEANPYNHPNIPNNSYAGYKTGIVSIPNPSWTIYNVTSAPYNAVINDGNDDQPAIQAAIEAAHTAGKGIVYLPAGTYTLNKPIYIKYDSIIVRGDGSTGGSATILDFKYSMYSMFTADIDASGKAGWVWWSTGLVWIGPGDVFKVNGAPDMIDDFEQWRSATTLATVTAVSNPGSFTITVDNTASLSAGMKLLLRYDMPANRTLIKHIHGHAATEAGIDNDSYVGDCSNITSPTEPYYYWPAIIQSISGNVVTFDRPLRIKVDPALWPATLRNITGVVAESGIEDVQIKGYNTTNMGHLVTPTSTSTSGLATLGGWNGVYINRSWNCWVDNVRFVNLECGVVFAAAKNCSALNTFVTSAATTSPVTNAYSHWYHHPYALRVFSSDNLVENFTIDGPSNVRHGINAEWYSSGNVYSKGLMKVGTFDSHRGSAFDQIRTEITVANDAGSAPGGSGTSGPFAGKRFAHWNITQQIQGGYTYNNGASRNGNDVYEPFQFPMGIFAGISGTRDNSNGEFVPPPSAGSVGSIDATGVLSGSLLNLYQAELDFRMSSLPIHILAFDIKKITDSKVRLNWTVAEPADEDKFIVQWSNDGTSFHDITTLNASSLVTSYLYDHEITDRDGTQFYRIKVITDAQKVFYSSIKSIKANKQEQWFSLYPNPVAENLTIAFNDINRSDLKSIRIINVMGQTVKLVNSRMVLNNQQIIIDVQELTPAHYYIEAVFTNKVYKKAFVKQ